MCVYKAILIVLISTLVQFGFSNDKIDDVKLKVYSVKDFIKHNNKNSCWVLMDKYIYDVTNFLDDHPGMYKVLFRCCGKDCTKGYQDKGIGELHSKKAHKIRKKMLIGILKEKI